MGKTLSLGFWKAETMRPGVQDVTEVPERSSSLLLSSVSKYQDCSREERIALPVLTL